jgi:hypothetical protein
MYNLPHPFVLQPQNYILQSTYFQYQTNISALEYVPATTGTFIIDVSTVYFHQQKHMYEIRFEIFRSQLYKT